MCGIAGIVDVTGRPVAELRPRLALMSRLLAHRGPDGDGLWTANSGCAGLAHRRLAIIDLSQSAAQPMVAPGPVSITYNGIGTQTYVNQHFTAPLSGTVAAGVLTASGRASANGREFSVRVQCR